MRGKKTTALDKAKVIRSKIASPDKSLKEIEAETGVNYETSRKILKEDMGEVVKSSDICRSILERDLEIIAEASEICRDYVSTIKSKGDPTPQEIRAIVQLSDISLKRYILLGGSIRSTEPQVFPDYSKMSDEELERAITHFNRS